MSDVLLRLDASGKYVPLTDNDLAQREIDAASVSKPAMTVSVFDYQFAGQAAAENIISDDDALAWVGTGKTPDRLIVAVKTKITDPDRQKRVLLFLAGTTSFPRYHELTPLLAASFGKDTPEKVDAFFLAASKR